MSWLGIAMTVAYLDHAATSSVGRRYKDDLLTALDPHPGHTVLDVGCGPGTDLPALAAAVAASPAPGSAFASARFEADALSGAVGKGRVIGVDASPAMVAEARRRCPEAEVLVGDVHHLPLGGGEVDRARVDRVLQHVADPARAVAELRRVLRPGGRVALAEPDWDTLVIADPDIATSRAYTGYVTGQVVRNATIGRRLAALLHEAGFETIDLQATAVLFTDHAEAEPILRMPDVARRGWEAGALARPATEAWLSRLREGPFVASFTLFTAVAG